MPASFWKQTSRTGAKDSLEEALDCFRASRCPSWMLSTYLGGQDCSRQHRNPGGGQPHVETCFPNSFNRGFCGSWGPHRRCCGGTPGTYSRGTGFGNYGASPCCCKKWVFWTLRAVVCKAARYGWRHRQQVPDFEHTHIRARKHEEETSIAAPNPTARILQLLWHKHPALPSAWTRQGRDATYHLVIKSHSTSMRE